jgi:biopolymer transport protein ExbB
MPLKIHPATRSPFGARRRSNDGGGDRAGRAVVAFCSRIGWLVAALPLRSVSAFAQDAAPTPAVDGTMGAAASAASAAARIGSSLLPHELSPWAMFLGADIVVKMVMLGLAFASLVTWTVWLVKTLELHFNKRAARAGLRTLTQGRSASPARGTLRGRDAVTKLFEAADHELELSAGLAPEGVKERIANEMRRIEAAAGRHMGRGLGVIATIGSTAPFVGLFGTVWGIMNSFIGISQSHTTNLAVVAPGIAEALLATACGLVAAIPAVVVYNMFARSITGYRAVLTDAATAVLHLFGRELDRRNLDMPHEIPMSPELPIAMAAE